MKSVHSTADGVQRGDVSHGPRTVAVKGEPEVLSHFRTDGCATSRLQLCTRSAVSRRFRLLPADAAPPGHAAAGRRWRRLEGVVKFTTFQVQEHLGNKNMLAQ